MTAAVASLVCMGNSGYMAWTPMTGGGGENPRVVLIEQLTSILKPTFGVGEPLSYGYLQV